MDIDQSSSSSSSSSPSSSSSSSPSPYMPLNPYAARPYEVDDKDKIAEILCEIARMDGWHDHHLIIGLMKTLGILINEHLPPPPDYPVCCGGNTNGYPAINEDAYLYWRLAKYPSLPTPATPSPTTPSPGTIFDKNSAWCKPGGPDLANLINTNKNSPKTRKQIVDDFFFNGSKIKDFTGQEIEDTYTSVINGRYQVSHVLFTSDKEDDEDDDVVGDDYGDVATSAIGNSDAISYIQKCFEDRKIIENIYIVRDVAYGNWADDICKWKSKTIIENNKNVKTFQIITAQMGAGIYDPGPSVSCVTGSGKRQGFATPTSGSRFAMFDPKNPIETVIDLPLYKNFDNNSSPENLIYTRFNCLLHSTNSSSLQLGDETTPHTTGVLKEYFKSANATLHMMDNQSVYSVDKDSSNKATDLSKLPLLDAVVKLTAKTGIEIPVTQSFDPKYITHIIQNSGVKKIASKKFGDHNLGITTLHPTLHFHKFEPTNVLGNAFTATLEKSNGIHGFLSYDRVAVEAALEYGAPFVIYNTHDGAIIFFSNELIDKFSKPELIFERNVKLLEQTIAKMVAVKAEYDRYKKTDFNPKKQKIEIIINAIYSILGTIEPAKNDPEYQRGIAIYYFFSSILKTYNRSITLINETAASYDLKYDNNLNPFQTTNNPLPDIQSNIQVANENIKKFSIRKQCNEIFDNIIGQYNNILSKLKPAVAFNPILIDTANLTDWFLLNNSIKISIKIRNFLDKLIESLISSITPFKHTQNPSCIRTFLNMVGVGQKLPNLGLPIAEEIVKSLEGGPAKDYFIFFLKNSVDNVINGCSSPVMKARLNLSINDMGENLKKTNITNGNTTTETLYSYLIRQIPITAEMSGGKTRRRKYMKIYQKIQTRHQKQKQKQKNTIRKINNRKTQKIMYGGRIPLGYEAKKKIEKKKIANIKIQKFQNKHKEYAKDIGAAWICWFLIQMYVSLSASFSVNSPVSFIVKQNIDTIHDNIDKSRINVDAIIQNVSKHIDRNDFDLAKVVTQILDPIPDSNTFKDRFNQLQLEIRRLQLQLPDPKEEYYDNNTHIIIKSIFGSNNEMSIFGSNNEMYNNFLKIYVQVGYAINNNESFNINKISIELKSVGKCIQSIIDTSIQKYTNSRFAFYYPNFSEVDFSARIDKLFLPINAVQDINALYDMIDDIDNDNDNDKDDSQATKKNKLDYTNKDIYSVNSQSNNDFNRKRLFVF